MEYIKPDNTINLSDKEKTLGLAKLLKTIHNGPAFLPHISIQDQIVKRYDNTYLNCDFVNCKKLNSTIQNFRMLENFIKKPTHCDLNPNNIIYSNGSYKAIDFEGAGLDDPIFDVATIAIFNFRNADVEKEFLKNYYGKVISDEQIIHYRSMKQTVLIYYGLEILSQIKSDDLSVLTALGTFDDIMNSINSGQLKYENPHTRIQLAYSMLNEGINISIQH